MDKKEVDFNCAVCLEIMVEPITLPCGHNFCYSCLDQYFNESNTCPLCRGEIKHDVVMKVNKDL